MSTVFHYILFLRACCDLSGVDVETLSKKKRGRPPKVKSTSLTTESDQSTQKEKVVESLGMFERKLFLS